MQKIAFQIFAYFSPHNTAETGSQQPGRSLQAPKVKIRGYRFSLIEMLMVIALMGMVFTMFMQFLQQGGSHVRAEAEQTEMYRHVAMLKNSFRKFVHDNGAIFSCSNKSVVFKNNNLMRIEAKRLVFKQGEHINSLQLPSKCIATFKLEHHSAEPDLLVLTISQKANIKLPGRLKYFMRLVASCPTTKQPVKNSEVSKK